MSRRETGRGGRALIDTLTFIIALVALPFSIAILARGFISYRIERRVSPLMDRFDRVRSERDHLKKELEALTADVERACGPILWLRDYDRLKANATRDADRLRELTATTERLSGEAQKLTSDNRNLRERLDALTLTYEALRRVQGHAPAVSGQEGVAKGRP